MKVKKVLIVYNYIAHYRIPIFNLLSKSSSPEYTILSGVKTDIPIKVADESLSNIKPENGGIKWIQVKNIWLLKYFLMQISVIKYSVSKKYDTIIYLGNMYYITTWIGAILAKFTGKRVIFWTHGFIREEKNFKGVLRSLFYRLADELLVYGQRAKDILISKGFSENKVKLIYNSLDYDEQLKFRNKSGIDVSQPLFENPTLPVFGFIGRLTKQKKVDFLIEILHDLISQNQQANLLIIGDGDQLEFLKEKAKELNLENYVCFYGACYDELRIYQLMSKINVVVSPGEVGLTAIHALSYGVPVITHNCFEKQMPEFEVIVEGVTGGFYDYSNPEKTLLILLKHWLFNTNRVEIKNNCYKIIDDYYNPYVQKKIFNSIV